MQQINNVTILPPTEVMIREQMRLLSEYYLGDSVNGFEQVQVKKAVEILLVKEDHEDKLLSWYVVDSDVEQFKVQIEFD